MGAYLCCCLARDAVSREGLLVESEGGCRRGWRRSTVLHRYVLLSIPHPLAEVPVNEGQRAAVEGLRSGLSVIHGPPGMVGWNCSGLAWLLVLHSAHTRWLGSCLPAWHGGLGCTGLAACAAVCGNGWLAGW